MTKSNLIREYLLFIILFLFVFLVICYKCLGREHFSSTKKKLPLDKAWKKRFRDLNGLIPIFYKGYFNQIKDKPGKKPLLKKNKIFISIASYRDDQCLDTVKNLSENADNPEDLVIVVCQQNSITDKDCLGWCNKHPTCKKTEA
mgnify:FL=1